MMKVSEIFLSVEGEGSRSGLPCVFVRLHGCNLRCSYCDSMYAVIGDDYKEMTVKEISDAVNSYNIHRVTITGGEPLIHEDIIDLITSLKKNNEINIETNGAVDIRCLDSFLRDEVFVTMDWKSLSSKMSHTMLESNLPLLSRNDVLKFVVGSEEDLNQMKDIVENQSLDCQIFVSPIFGQIDPADIVEFLLNNHLTSCRIQLQIHKLIWDKDRRGV